MTSGSTCLQLIHKKPAAGGISAVLGTGSVYTFYGPDEPKYADLKRKLFVEDLPQIMPALDLAGEPFPIVWTTDLIPYTDDDGNDATDDAAGAGDSTTAAATAAEGDGGEKKKKKKKKKVSKEGEPVAAPVAVDKAGSSEQKAKKKKKEKKKKKKAAEE